MTSPKREKAHQARRRVQLLVFPEYTLGRQLEVSPETPGVGDGCACEEIWRKPAFASDARSTWVR